MKKNTTGLIGKVLIACTLSGMTIGNLGCPIIKEGGSILQDLSKDIKGLSERRVNVIYIRGPDPAASAHQEETGTYPLIPPNY